MSHLSDLILCMALALTSSILLFAGIQSGDRRIIAGAIVCALFGVSAIRSAIRKTAFRRQMAIPDSVQIKGGVRIQPRFVVRAFPILVVAVAGVLGLWSAGPGQLAIQLTSAALIVLGMFAAILAYRRRDYLMFCEAGLVLGNHAYSYCIDWDNLQELRTDEMFRNPVVLIAVHDDEALIHTLQPGAWPTSRAENSLRKVFRSNRRLFGSSVAIFMDPYPIGAATVIKALRIYNQSPELRKDLSAR